MAAGLPTAYSCDRVYGTRQRQYLPGNPADRQALQSSGVQLGVCRRKDPDMASLGLLATPLYGSPARGLVPRHLCEQRHTLPARRGGFYPLPDRRESHRQSYGTSLTSRRIAPIETLDWTRLLRAS